MSIQLSCARSPAQQSYPPLLTPPPFLISPLPIQMSRQCFPSPPPLSNLIYPPSPPPPHHIYCLISMLACVTPIQPSHMYAFAPAAPACARTAMVCSSTCHKLMHYQQSLQHDASWCLVLLSAEVTQGRGISNKARSSQSDMHHCARLMTLYAANEQVFYLI